MIEWLQFLNKPLLIERQHLERVRAMAMSGDSFKGLRAKPSVTHNNATAIIPIHGILSKRAGQFDEYLEIISYDELRRQIEAALNNDRVKTILLDIDSPGGETSGLFDLVDFIYHARAQKQIIAYCNDFAYSAAYAIASSATKVFINRTSSVGSIGVIATHIDQTIFDKKQGVKYTTIFTGGHKNDFSPHEPISKQATQTLQLEVDRLYEMLIELISRNRGLKASVIESTEAAIYFGTDAIAAKLADEMISQNNFNQQRSMSIITTAEESNDYRTEILELYRLCKLARMPEKLGELIESGTRLNEAREYLMETLAKKNQAEISSFIKLDERGESPVLKAARERRGVL